MKQYYNVSLYCNIYYCSEAYDKCIVMYNCCLKLKVMSIQLLHCKQVTVFYYLKMAAIYYHCNDTVLIAQNTNIP